MSSELTPRAALRYVTALMGVGLSAPAIVGILDGCSAKKVVEAGISDGATGSTGRRSR